MVLGLQLAGGYIDDGGVVCAYTPKSIEREGEKEKKMINHREGTSRSFLR